MSRSTSQGSVSREPASRGSVSRSSWSQGSMSREPVSRESVSRGSVSRSSWSHGSMSGDLQSSTHRGSVTSQTSEDEEVHDLVLMFANSRIPRGSDAFQTILDDLLPLKEKHEGLSGLDEVDSGNVDSTDDETLAISDQLEAENPKESQTRFDSPKPKNSSVNTIINDQSRSRNNSPKSSRVHWPNAERDIASSPTTDQLHHARIYVKTVPSKPILKHDDDIKDHINVKT